MVRGATGRESMGGDRARADRRTVLRIVGSGAVATALAGCSDGAEPTDADADSSGNGTETDDADADETGALKIGHLAPLELPIGLESQRSAEVAVAELNENGGVFDSRVRLVSEATHSDPAAAADAADRLVSEDGVDVLVGSSGTEVARGIVDSVAENDVPCLLTGTGSTAILEDTVGEAYDQYRNVFRTGPINGDLKAELMGDYAAFLADTHGWTDFAHLSEEVPWTVPFRDRFADEIESRGLELVYEATVSSETNDYTPILNDIEDEAADALFRFADLAVHLQLAWLTDRYPFSIEGIHRTAMDPEFWERTEGACSYETSGLTGGGGIVELTDRTLEFVEAYEDAVGDEPPGKPLEAGVSTYDAIHFYARAVADAGTLDYRTELDAIVDAMLSLEHAGAAGEISLYGEDEAYPHDVRPVRNGDGRIANYPVIQWQSARGDGGRQECVFPRKHATASHRVAPWL